MTVGDERTPPCFLGRGSRWPRALLQWASLWPVVRWFCHPLRVVDRGRVPVGPVVFVANHTSHADTALVLRALPGRVRRLTHPAAAEDHFWRKPLVGAFVSLLTGAFPFPRKGSKGLDRAERLLQRGRNVLLFPEGTRSTNGTVGEFQCGIGRLARSGYRVVPIGIAGARDVLPKDRRVPHPAPVAVVLGNPRTYEGSITDITCALREEVVALSRSAERERTNGPPSVYERLRRFALSRFAPIVVFAWAVAEAIAWPIVPDFVILPLAVAAPRRTMRLLGAALLGTLCGGLAAYAAGATTVAPLILDGAPLVTDRMVTFAGSTLRENDPSVLLHQPWSGVPYKVFAFQAAALSVGPFMLMSAIGRGARFLCVGVVGVIIGKVARPVWRRAMGPVLVVYSAVFAIGLFRVVSSWS